MKTYRIHVVIESEDEDTDTYEDVLSQCVTEPIADYDEVLDIFNGYVNAFETH